MRITKAIREVDTNHLVIIEGNCWGNNYKGMLPLWDENMVLSFHKYWSNNDTATIQDIMNLRKEQNVPIWLGESGENSNVWFQEVLKLVESNNIGWAFWPMKKLENIAGVTSVKEPKGYDRLLKYWKDGKNKPSVEEAKAILMQLAENYKIENVIIKHDVIDAMFRQVNSAETKPYKNHSLPGKVFATEYDLGPINQAYSDKDFQNLWVTSGKHTEWNSGNQMRNDGVDIQKCNDKISNGYNITSIEEGEWLQYTLNSDKAKNFEVSIRYSNEKSNAKVYLVDEKGNKLSKTILLPASGGNDKWATLLVGNINLKSGINKIRVYSEKGNFNLNYLEFNHPK
jgi:hypothetical protein